jgi:fumarate reductase flavoprotein subunit
MNRFLDKSDVSSIAPQLLSCPFQVERKGLTTGDQGCDKGHQEKTEKIKGEKRVIMDKGHEYETSWDLEADVVIVGAGGAGLAAAIEASGSGADTIVFEKQSRIWDSSTALSAGMISFAETDVQGKQGIHDSSDLFYQDIMEVGLWKSDPRMVQTYVSNQLDTFYWLTRLGLKWGNVSAAAGMSVPRGHFTDPLECVRILNAAAEMKGTRIFLNSAVTGLVTDDEKRVVGCRFSKAGHAARARARKGVILATGGFARDTERLGSIDPRFPGVTATAGLGHTGDGLRWAEALGAQLKDMEHVKPSFELHVQGTSSREILLMFYLGAIIVNKRGERFVNESISYKEIGMACLDQPHGIGFQVFDQKIYDLGVRNAKRAGASMPVENFVMGLDEGRIRLLQRAHTIDELTGQMGAPSNTLRKTIDHYNTGAKNGRDMDFGRTTLSGRVGSLTCIDTPPFYAYESKSHFLATYAGLTVDDEMHVLTVKGKIPGLYAAGEVVGGFHGASYHTGTALGKAIIFGRIAGSNASQGR